MIRVTQRPRVVDLWALFVFYPVFSQKFTEDNMFKRHMRLSAHVPFLYISHIMRRSRKTKRSVEYAPKHEKCAETGYPTGAGCGADQRHGGGPEAGEKTIGV